MKASEVFELGNHDLVGSCEWQPPAPRTEPTPIQVYPPNTWQTCKGMSIESELTRLFPDIAKPER